MLHEEPVEPTETTETSEKTEKAQLEPARQEAQNDLMNILNHGPAEILQFVPRWG
jgi:hypothetical protein